MHVESVEIDNVSQIVPHCLSCKALACANFAIRSKSKTWLRAGVHIEVRERDEVIADLVPRTPPKPAVEWPDFEAT